MSSDDEVVLDMLPFIRVYKSGRLERFLGTAVVPAGLDPATGVASKDVLIDPATNLTARLYLPGSPPYRALPVLVYYHGGGFVIETAFSPTYHNYLNSLVAAAGVVVVSVDYRRAPEHPLPAAYDDSWAALRWVLSQPAEEPWLAPGRADLGRLFLAGDSAGANIVHNMAVRAASEGLGGGDAIEGLLLVHPFFWGVEPVGSESKDPKERMKVEGIWKFVFPGTNGVDDPLLNPMAEGAPSLAALPCRRMVVAVAEKDMLRERGRAYYEAVKGSGWQGEARLLEAEGSDAEHVFHLLNPKSNISSSMLRTVAAFLNSE
ncbi:tuliposide A-converting enzyme 1, chloroplastic-like [Canna indica]|uniref:Tuliposide A-converting enzyme 1, chloroplastic-like n=1 Tax=Canna indica TaxID=4628 RepID=A0AAQ3JT85_9LILI|nr:tuliposide A-converting enzyme 1, chloroplastic-like [Canna indica]